MEKTAEIEESNVQQLPTVFESKPVATLCKYCTSSVITYTRYQPSLLSYMLIALSGFFFSIPSFI